MGLLIPASWKGSHSVQAPMQGDRAGASPAGPFFFAWSHSARARPGLLGDGQEERGRDLRVLACKGLTSMLHAGEPAAHAHPKKAAADIYMRRTLRPNAET